MAISLAAVGAKITAALFNAVAVQARAQGLTQVVPGSVQGTGVTVTTQGTVILSGQAGSVNIDGVFTSAYDNYLIAVDIVFASAATAAWQLRSAGTGDSTAGHYQVQYLRAGGTTAAAGQGTNNTSGGIASTAANELSCMLEMFRPALASPTRAIARSDAFLSSGPTNTAEVYTSRHTQSSSYDGMNIGAGANMTGTIRIYGYNNG